MLPEKNNPAEEQNNDLINQKQLNIQKQFKRLSNNEILFLLEPVNAPIFGNF